MGKTTYTQYEVFRNLNTLNARLKDDIDENWYLVGISWKDVISTTADGEREFHNPHLLMARDVER